MKYKQTSLHTTHPKSTNNTSFAMKSPDFTSKSGYTINPNVSVNLKRKFSEMESQYHEKSKTSKNMSILNFVQKKFKN